MKKSIFIALFLLLPTLASAQQAQYGGNSGDPCAIFPHSVAAVTFSAAAGPTQLVALAASKSVYVCGFTVVTAATSTFQLSYGTGVNCATGNTLLSGSLLASTTWTTAANTTQVVTPTGQAVCGQSTGATGQANGWISYVQL